ncbi:MAG: hypothetical protein LR015_03015 [Verrucomicrobia bacterium]|nr:hypothetical protein [Verrucomicrobiota bacterium]
MIHFLEKRREHWGHSHLPPVFCGDFNTGRRNLDDATMYLWRHLSTESSYTLLPTRAKTFPSPWPQRTLDFIFLPPVFWWKKNR